MNATTPQAHFRSATAFSPASVGNVGVGFDLLGHALEGIGDTVTATRIDEPVVRVTSIRGVVTDLPFDPEQNTAARAVAAWRAALGLDFGVELAIEKGIPLGSGLGGSAASATAALTAANALLAEPLMPAQLYPFAMEGERAASGSLHGDNVGPQLLGGLVLATADRVVPIPVPPGLVAVVVHPHFVLETRKAREALRGVYALNEFVAQSEGLALVLAGCFGGDFELIGRGLKDVLVEPRRAALIPGFAEVKAAALAAGALGASISGAGPSVFAWFSDRERAAAAGLAMAEAFAGAGLASDIIVSAVANAGAQVVSRG
ncbi:MAG: homoserine kinase [Rhodanobacteraceae bacterium]|nr:homoserine kinase [Rhodanobacteraceae bacterium]